MGVVNPAHPSVLHFIADDDIDYMYYSLSLLPSSLGIVKVDGMGPTVCPLIRFAWGYFGLRPDTSTKIMTESHLVTNNSTKGGMGNCLGKFNRIPSISAM